jgi:prephenate dehydrogenase
MTTYGRNKYYFDLKLVIMKIAVVGGSGSFGRLFARLFKEDGYEVVITGRNTAKGERVAKELGVKFTRDNVKAAREGDVVIISVYIENTLDVVEEVAPHVRPGCLLMDVTSVKVEPCTAMEKLAGEKVEVIGTHPMFGPRVSSIEGLSFILTPIRAKKWDKFLLDFLEKHKAKVFITTPEEHDRIMGVVQGLTHFAYISVASTLWELRTDVRYTKKFASPIYELMLDLIARIVGQSPQLYASIQTHNPFIAEVHEAFIKKATELKDVVARKDVKAFAEIMASSARHIGDIDASMGRSDKAILALTSELKRLMDSVGKEVALRHIYSGAVHMGVVKEVNPDKVVLNAMNGEEVALKLSNIELLNAEFLRQWKLDNLPRKRRDFSVILPRGVEEKSICSFIVALDSRVSLCEVIDTYEGKQIPKGKKSITLRVESTDFTKGDFRLIEKALIGLGGVLR